MFGVSRNHRASCGRLCAGMSRRLGLSEVLFKGDSESATQALVDEMQVERTEEAVVEESPKFLYQSGSEAEDTAQRIESLTPTLREKFGRKVASKSIASSRPDRPVVLSQSEKRYEGVRWSVGTGRNSWS